MNCTLQKRNGVQTCMEKTEVDHLHIHSPSSWVRLKEFSNCSFRFDHDPPGSQSPAVLPFGNENVLSTQPPWFGDISTAVCSWRVKSWTSSLAGRLQPLITFAVPSRLSEFCDCFDLFQATTACSFFKSQSYLESSIGKSWKLVSLWSVTRRGLSLRDYGWGQVRHRLRRPCVGRWVPDVAFADRSPNRYRACWRARSVPLLWSWILIFLNGSSVLPYMTHPPPGLGPPLGQVTVFHS